MNYAILTRLLPVLLCVAAVPLDARETKAKPAAAKTQHVDAATTAGTSKYDTKLPVEISSDTLEVLQRENKAIFKGNVIAVQGKLRLNADKMIVHYKQKDANAPATNGPQQAGDMGAVSLTEVEGHVLMATPEESAEGDKGSYDVDKKFLHLTGDNVVLTREQNILRGKAVDYDLATGRSVLTNGGETGTAKGDTRVRGVFVPKSDSAASLKKGNPAEAGTKK